MHRRTRIFSLCLILTNLELRCSRHLLECSIRRLPPALRPIAEAVPLPALRLRRPRSQRRRAPLPGHWHHAATILGPFCKIHSTAMDLVAGKQASRKLPTQGKLRSLRHALEWDGHGRERHCLKSSDFWEKERGREREIREAKMFYWFILMSWE